MTAGLVTKEASMQSSFFKQSMLKVEQVVTVVCILCIVIAVWGMQAMPGAFCNYSIMDMDIVVKVLVIITSGGPRAHAIQRGGLGGGGGGGLANIACTIVTVLHCSETG